MQDGEVAFKIAHAQNLTKDIKRDFRMGYVAAARRKAEALSVLAAEIAHEIVRACSDRELT